MTVDPWMKFNNMQLEPLQKEIRTMTEQRFRMRPGSQVYQQLGQMINTAQNIAREKQMIESHRQHNKDKAPNEVINIGEITEEVYTPNYTSDELLNILVQEYKEDPKK
jgi:hypothetical protein